MSSNKKRNLTNKEESKSKRVKYNSPILSDIQPILSYKNENGELAYFKVHNNKYYKTSQSGDIIPDKNNGNCLPILLTHSIKEPILLTHSIKEAIHPSLLWRKEHMITDVNFQYK